MATNDENDNARWAYEGDGSTVAFAYDNKIFADSELDVYVDAVLQTLTTHYTVSNAGTADGGNVTFVTAPTDGASVVIVRDVQATQQSDYVDGEQFPADVIENDFDRAIICIQQLIAQQVRTVRLSDSDSTASLSGLPVAASRLGKVLGFDATNGDVEMLTPNSDTYITLTAYAETLIAAASAGAARTVLGLGTAATGDIGSDVQAYQAAQATATWEAGTGTTESVVSPAKVKAAIDALASSASDVQTFTSSGTWTKPSSGTITIVEAWGAGGGGGARAATSGGGGGGGGAYTRTILLTSTLGSTETVTIGAGGAGGAMNGNPGVVGGDTTFGSHVTAYGGGGGGTGGGGGGGGTTSAGATAAGSNGGAGGGYYGGAAGVGGAGGAPGTGFDGGGASGETASASASSYYGGGGGGGGNFSGATGGSSVWGGGGGAGARSGVVGSSVYGGAGGANDTAGTAPGGGGGSGDDAANAGAGAAGQCRVTTY